MCSLPSTGRWGTGAGATERSDPTLVSIDCHVHTDASVDSSAGLDAVLTAAVEAGLDGLVVTDHDAVGNALAAAERAPKYGLVGIPGVEVSTAAGHLLAIGVGSVPPVGVAFDRTVAWIREAGGVAVVPHPFQRTRHGVGADAIDDCDGIEVFNAHSITGIRNRQATRFAGRRGYPRFAGSDAHRARNVGRAHTVVALAAETPTADRIVDAMRAGRTATVGSRLAASQYLRKLAGSARRNSERLLGVG